MWHLFNFLDAPHLSANGYYFFKFNCTKKIDCNLLSRFIYHMSFYAVAVGKEIGIYTNWLECKSMVIGYPGSKYKKFNTLEDATHFIESTKISTKPDYYVYTDGSCINNGKKSAIAGIGIYFAENDPRNVSRKITGKQSNNTAELEAIIQTYPIIQNDLNNGKHIAIGTDSHYAILCATTYGEKQEMANWINDIPNKELVKTIYDTYKNTNVQFMQIKAHTNNTDIHSIGNDGADKLANLAIGFESCPYANENKIYLNVPFHRKNEIKEFDGVWDAKCKKWYILNSNPNKTIILQTFKIADEATDSAKK